MGVPSPCATTEIRDISTQAISKPKKSQIRSDQFPYKEGHNTTRALIKWQHHLLSWLDTGADFVKVYSFDFSKAFNLVSCEIECNKLKLYNINPCVINWLISSLSNRKQRVIIDGVSTKFVGINRGVPPRTVLGPVLFSIMVKSDIMVLYPNKNLLLKYADDITLSVFIRPSFAELSLINVQNI